jgi:C_GCAxxG_C_C family probable redox protein
MKKLNRRRFLGRLTMAAIAGFFLGGCTRNEKSSETPAPVQPVKTTFEDALEENRKLPRELLFQLLDQKVDQYMQLSHHCAQSSFMALKEQFRLESGEVVKALTPLAGIAERGETCGAVTGSLAAMGLIFGRGEQRLNDWDTYRSSLVPAGEFCDQFVEEFGSTMCHEIQKGEFGRCYHLTDPEELKEFQQADATSHCSKVVKKAVRIAAGIILEKA